MFKIKPVSNDHFNMAYDVFEDTKKNKSLDHIEMIQSENGFGYQAFLLFWVKVIP